MKVTHTEEAVADIVEAITYLNERNPTAAANLDAEIARCIERLGAQEFDGPVSWLPSGALVRSWAVPPFRIYYQRHPDELLIERVYHQTRRPITRYSIRAAKAAPMSLPTAAPFSAIDCPQSFRPSNEVEDAFANISRVHRMSARGRFRRL